MPKSLPSPELLRKLLRYDADSGTLYWNNRTPDMFEDGKRRAASICNQWNSKNAGNMALTSTCSGGYRIGAVNGVMVRAHRAVWAINFGYWPNMQIDHINGVRSDNRIENLREVCHQDNMRNIKAPSTNTSGHVGITFLKSEGKWKAGISVDGKTKHLGVFQEKSAAISARKDAEAKYGFHENHGRFE